MPIHALVMGLWVCAGAFALLGLAGALRARAHWRVRRRFAAGHRGFWSVVLFALALLAAFGAIAFTGLRRLSAEAEVARIDTRAIGAQRYAVAIVFPDGSSRDVELAGDDWQLEVRVIKWTRTAVVFGAPPLYQLDRISGRYRDVDAERTQPRSVIALAPSGALDLWHLKQRCPRCLPWIDAEFGSAAYLPMVDGGHFIVSLAAAGGLVARAADPQTAAKLDQDRG